MTLHEQLSRSWKPDLNARVEPVRLRRQVEDLFRLFGDRQPRIPREFVLASIQAAVRRTWDTRRSLESLPRYERKWLPYVVFLHQSNSGPPLGGEPDFVANYLKRLGEEPRRLLTAIWVFLRDYPTNLATFTQVRTGLDKALRAADLGQLEIWRVRNEKYALLAEGGPECVARMLLDRDQRPTQEIVADAGLVGELAAGGFTKAVQRHALAQVAHWLAEETPGAESLERPFSCIEDGNSLRFPDLCNEVAEALLMPHVSKAPLSATKERIQAFLLRYLNDPRIFPAKWQRVREDARQVLLRWLVEGTLEDFFRLIGKHAWMEHWKFRQAFWAAYLRKGFIDDAWVVLGEEAQKVAKLAFRDSAPRFGRLRASGDKKHSVLLIRIRELVIAEWSHNGTCRVWANSNSTTPGFYEFDYTGDQLREDSDYSQRHHGAPQYTWQMELAGYIRRQTGIQMFTREFSVR